MPDRATTGGDLPLAPAPADGAALNLVFTVASLQAMVNSVDQMIWSTRPDGFHDFYNRRWYDYTGMPEGSTDGEAWNGMFHPEDRERAWASWRRSLETGEPYQIEYRLRHASGEYRWVIGRAQCVRDEAGRILRWYGTCTDVHDLKMAEEQRELIARELSHRIKNIFAVVTSLVSFTSRGDAAAKPFAGKLLARLHALARAHDYVRPHSQPERPDDSLLGLVRLVVAPYEGEAGTAAALRFRVDGDDCPVGSHAATAVALIVHELATNAIKYGALSRPHGRVSVRGERRADDYLLVWRERGGPPVTQAPDRRGFGTILAHRAATGQLGAEIEQDWAPDGLTVHIKVPQGAFAR
ncbi:MAG: PAS domain-containing protein [Methylobacteriaceae bacterium]|nr:PAS domain-containing protein [Methylobacteriaceae bacterium]